MVETPDPNDLDVDDLARQVEELYEHPRPACVEAVYLIGSFADPAREIDRSDGYLSDVDLFFVYDDEDCPSVELDPFVKLPRVDLRFDDAVYEMRSVDRLGGTRDAFENRATDAAIELPVELSRPP